MTSSAKTTSAPRSVARAVNSNSGSKAATKTVTTMAQTLPKNFKYGAPPTAPHIMPRQPTQVMPSSLSFSLPPTNLEVGMNIVKLGSLSMRDSMSMPAGRVFMGQTSSQVFKPNTNTNITQQNQAPKASSMMVGSFPCFQLMGSTTLNQLPEEDVDPRPKTKQTSFEDINENVNENEIDDEVLFDMDD